MNKHNHQGFTFMRSISMKINNQKEKVEKKKTVWD